MNVSSRDIARFKFRGFQGKLAVCQLEILQLQDGRTAVIATEREDNPSTSVTNVAEHLASHVCDCFSIEPEKLAWIEHYGYPAHGSNRERTYDLVDFSRRNPEPIVWSQAVLRHKPDGWPGYFTDPVWRPMKTFDWMALGLPSR